MNLLTFHMKILTFSILCLFYAGNPFAFSLYWMRITNIAWLIVKAEERNKTIHYDSRITESGRICYFCHWHLRPHQKLLTLLYSVFHQILIRCCTYHILKASATFTYTDRCRFCNILQVNLFHFLSVLSLNLFYIFCLCYALCSGFPGLL